MVNFSINYTSPAPYPVVERITDVSVLQNFCERVEHNLFYFVLIYWVFSLVLQLLFRFKVLSVVQYAKASQSFHVSFIVFGAFTLAYMWFRL